MKKYFIIKKDCVACNGCLKNCPVGAIGGLAKEGYEIDQQKCIHCGKCKSVCKFHAIIEE
ncbi:DUF362 domain-containing protein [Inediibacterium massiliense]|uniref:DUF362 domain-containing protein n=1 Tax=Inediibacterium massiliense TaxID=1658111 RepID=UPI0006B61502|nr:4Fe-4S binding protein [Inediibacterium massiliense]